MITFSYIDNINNKIINQYCYYLLILSVGWMSLIDIRANRNCHENRQLLLFETM